MYTLKKILSSYNFLSIYVLLLILFDLLLLRFPLTDVFGYEYSLFNSVIIVLLSGIFNITLQSKNIFPEQNKDNFDRSSGIFFLVFLILPAVISIVNSFFTISCSYLEGLKFYLVLLLPSIVIGFALGMFTVVFFKRFRIIFFLLIYLIIFSITFFELYYNPQIYFFNPIFGYFPGTIYDEAISVDLRLVIYRLLNLIYFGSLFYILYRFTFKTSKLTKKLIFWPVLIIPILFIYFSQQFGFSTTFSKLEKDLGGKAVTPHFNIYYPASLDSNYVKNLILNHEYYYNQLNSFFQFKISKRVNSFVFLDDNQKKELFGSQNADVAKTWQYSIYITRNDYNSTLKHELAHCYSADFGVGIFKVADGLNPSLIEGIATAADPIYGNNSIDYLAYQAYNNGFKIELSNLYNQFNFFLNTSSLSYIYAGSFTKYLIKVYGIKKFISLYKDLDFYKVYGDSISALQIDYYTYLESLNYSSNINKAYYYFGSKSIFYKVCPRYVAKMLQDAWSEYSHKNYKYALNSFNEILQVTNNYSALIGKARSMAKLNDRDKAIKLLEAKLPDFHNTSNFYNLEFTLADLLAENKNYFNADTLYSSIINQNPSNNLFYLSSLRKKLISSYQISEYLNGSELDKFLILSEINKKYYIYSSIPVLIDLSDYLGENYEMFVKDFDKPINVDDFLGSYAVYRLSLYMSENADFLRSRKMAALSIRYGKDKNFNTILLDNFNKINWIYSHSKDIINISHY